MTAGPTTPWGQAAPGGPRTLVLGLGNPLLGDDSVGLRVVQELRPRLAGRPNLTLEEDYWGGLRLMERMIGFDRAIVVDAIRSGAEPGTVQVLPVEAATTRRSTSAHDVDLSTALALGHQTGARLPALADVRVVAIEADEVFTFSEKCTPRVEAGIGPAADAVLGLLRAWR